MEAIKLATEHHAKVILKFTDKLEMDAFNVI